MLKKSLPYFRLPAPLISLAVLIASSGFANAQRFEQQEWPAYQKNELESLWLEGGVGLGYPGLSALTLSAEFIQFGANCDSVMQAYHDSATHNVNGDGLGGLDQSIRFELDRPENVGEGLKQTLRDLGRQPSKYVSSADVIALGLIHAVAICNGPLVPFRGGRIDATEAGPPGVPEPHGTLEEHTESFRKQGFNRTEMIELVACGHTLGAVRNVDFPDLVETPEEGSSVTNMRLATFDTTKSFDNAVVQEYLNSTTKNVLVVHPNKTLTSDFRIFSSDGNSTMRRLANPGVFQDRCRDLFERMVNTVPRDVELGEVIRPIEVKIGRSFLNIRETGLSFHTDIRFLSSNPNPNVTLKWRGRTDQATVDSASPALVTENGHNPLAMREGFNAIVHYWFHPSIDASSSISEFWFEIDEGDGSENEPKVHDNNGAAFPVERDTLLFAVGQSFLEWKNEHREAQWNLAVAILKAAGAVSDVTASCILVDEEGRATKLTLSMTLDPIASPIDGYDIYRATSPLTPSGKLPRIIFDVAATIDDEVVTEENLYNFYIKKEIFEEVSEETAGSGESDTGGESGRSGESSGGGRVCGVPRNLADLICVSLFWTSFNLLIM